jgi:hypothetical protein
MCGRRICSPGAQARQAGCRVVIDGALPDGVVVFHL